MAWGREHSQAVRCSVLLFHAELAETQLWTYVHKVIEGEGSTPKRKPLFDKILIANRYALMDIAVLL